MYMNPKNHGVPDYWLTSGTAPNFSREVARASETVRLAEGKLLAALRHQYPRGRRVQVVHGRGQFYGTVSGWDAQGSRVMVLNERTGKCCKWWAAHVQLVPMEARG